MKIVWAVDPFDTHVTILRTAARAIRALAGGSKTVVIPTFVWGGSSEFIDDLKKRGQEELSAAIEKTRIKDLAPLEIHAVPHSSCREEARKLVEYARESGAELIVVSSHGKKGLKRAFLGSFAETLSLISDIPLFIVRPDSKQLPVKNIFFPTDFSDASIEAFKHIVSFAKPRKSQITIFHKIAIAPYPSFDFPLKSTPRLRELFAAEAKSMAEEGRKLAEIAAQSGVRARVIVDSSSPGTVSDTIVRRARKSNALIAISSNSGAISSLLLGSTARQVLRQADTPVWVIHPAARTAKKKEPVFEVTARDIERDLYERPA